MEAPLRRRVAAVLTCVAVAFGTFGYMQRNATEVASNPPPAECDETKQSRTLGCLILFGD